MSMGTLHHVFDVSKASVDTQWVSLKSCLHRPLTVLHNELALLTSKDVLSQQVRPGL